MTNARKAVVTLAQVSEAFAEYAEVRKAIGSPVDGHSFDKGARGKGFAQYDDKDNIVRSFESKEDGLTFYGRYVEVAREIMTALGHEVPASTPESAEEATDGTNGGTVTAEAAQNSEGDNSATVPAQTRRRVKASA